MSRKFRELTRLAIRNLAPGQTIREHGIIAERLPDGDVRFSINVMVDRQRIHKVIGRGGDGLTREKAERALEIIRTQAREGRLQLPAGRKVQRSFGEAAEEYLRAIEGHSKFGRNIARKRQHIRSRPAPHFKGMRVDQLSDAEVTAYVSNRKKDGATGATVNRELATLSHFLGRCIEWGWCRTKPPIYKDPEPRKQIITLSEADKQRLVEAAAADQDPLTWLFTVIAMGTGMRHSEILRAKWSEIDFAGRRIYVGRAKAGQRDQPVSAVLRDRLETEWEQLGRPEGYLFPAHGADAMHPHRQTMAMQFRRTVIRANLDPSRVTPHILRHTAITELVKSGVDLPTIQRISGHKTLAMVLRYTQLTDDHVDRSMAKLDSSLSTAITPKLHTEPEPRPDGPAPNRPSRRSNPSGAGGRTRTGTIRDQGILSPRRLPFRHARGSRPD